jgi:superfamily II DNA or RNA helicase
MRESRNQYGKNKKNILHGYLFPAKGSKMTLDDYGDSFPMNQICVESYDLDPKDLDYVNRCYADMADAHKLAQINEIRQKIENIKVPIIIELLEDYYGQNKSIVIFVNYVSSYQLIAKYLQKHRIAYAQINGTQDTETREAQIHMFQSNQVRICVSMIQAGGVAISLHDTTGHFPRVSIISPSYSCIELIQTLGRIYRTGVQSPCVQKIVYCAGTWEDRIAMTLRAKRDVLDTVTDDDLGVFDRDRQVK